MFREIEKEFRKNNEISAIFKKLRLNEKNFIFKF